MVRLRYPRRVADNRSLRGHPLRRGPESHGKAARDGRHLAGSVNHGADMPAHGSSATSASAVSGKRSRICCFVFDGLPAVAPLIPTRSSLKSVFSPVGVATLHRRARICIYDARVAKCVCDRRPGLPAEPPSLPGWAYMWEDELLERIAPTSATNIEATSRSRARSARRRDVLGTHRRRAGHDTAVGVRRVPCATWRAR
jgi:hypothetical protein